MRKGKKEKEFGLKTAETLTELDVISGAEQAGQQLMDAMDNTEGEMQAMYERLTAAETPGEMEQAVQAQLRSLKRTANNARKAYYRAAGMQDELNARWEDVNRGAAHRLIPANSRIDLEEKRSNHFARGLNLYKLVLICFIGCFAGVIIEMLWCLLTRGYVESRAGVVYGPFNFVYGFGAVTLSAALYKFRNRGKWLSFLGGFAVGSVVEYLCSWWQEACFGSRSWDYSHMPFNLNGRICLLYSVFWGLLGVLWIKGIYPWMARIILKIPNRAGKVLTWLAAAFLIFNGVVTVIAVLRWSQRVAMVPPSNAFWEFIDMRFTDARMQRIFANMKFG